MKFENNTPYNCMKKEPTNIEVSLTNEWDFWPKINNVGRN